LPLKDLFRNPGRVFSRKPAEAAAQPPEPAKIEFIPGAEPQEQLDPWWWLVAAIIVAFVLLVTLKSDPYWGMFKFVADGVWLTIQLTLISFVFILFVGMVGGLGRIANNPAIRFVSTLYVEIIRGIPLLVQLIWWYYAAPALVQSIGRGIHFQAMANYHSNAMFLAVVGLVICYGPKDRWRRRVARA
jgi:polar amino acid transport system permease protein